MTISAKADKITIFERQLRVLVQVLDVVDGRRLSLPAVPLAALALVAVPAEDPLTLALPGAGLVEFLGVHGCSLNTLLPGRLPGLRAVIRESRVNGCHRIV